MTTTEKTTATAADPALRPLKRLIGTWQISGGSEGEATYEWLDGGYFLLQRGEVRRNGTPSRFLQVIGRDRSPGVEPADEIRGRLYTSDGQVLQYVCEADKSTLTIWFGEKGSPAVYRGTWDDSGDVIHGRWDWPGGGYDETMTRVR
jgi:hypothetical protein